MSNGGTYESDQYGNLVKVGRGTGRSVGEGTGVSRKKRRSITPAVRRIVDYYGKYVNENANMRAERLAQQSGSREVKQTLLAGRGNGSSQKLTIEDVAKARQNRVVTDLRRQGYSARLTPKGYVIATKNNKQIIIEPPNVKTRKIIKGRKDLPTVVTGGGRILKLPRSAKVNLSNLSLLDRKIEQKAIPITPARGSLTKKQRERLLRGEIILRDAKGTAIALEEGRIKPKKRPPTLLKKIDNARRAPVQYFSKLVDGDADVRYTLRSYADARGGFNKLTKEEKAAAIASAYVGAYGRLGRGVTSVFFTPEDVAKGVYQLVTNFPKTAGGIYDEFQRDPVGTLIEFWAAKKAIQFGGKAISQTSAGQSFSSVASKAASRLSKIGRSIPGATRLLNAASKLKAAAKSTARKTKAYNLYKKAAGKFKKIKSKGKPNEAWAREILKKIEKNKSSLKQWNKIIKKVSKSKTKVSLKKANRQIKLLKRDINKLNKKLLDSKVSPTRRAILRRRIQKELNQKVKPKKTTKVKKPAKQIILRKEKPGTRISVRIGIDRRIKQFPIKTVRAINKAVGRFVKQSTKKAITSINRSLRKSGYAIKRAAGKTIKPLSKPVKTTLGKIKALANDKYIDVRIEVIKLKGTLKRYGYTVSKVGKKIGTVGKKIGTGARKTGVKLGKGAKRRYKSFSDYYKTAKNFKKLRRQLNMYKAVRYTKILKDGIDVWVKKGYATIRKGKLVLDKGLNKYLSKFNKISPVKIKIRIHKDGKIYSYYRGKRVVKKPTKLSKGQGRRIRSAVNRGKKRTGYDSLAKTEKGRKIIIRRIKKGKLKLTDLSKRTRSLIRKEISKLRQPEFRRTESGKRVMTSAKSKRATKFTKNDIARIDEVSKKLESLYNNMKTGIHKVNKRTTMIDILRFTKKLKKLSKGRNINNIKSIKKLKQTIKKTKSGGKKSVVKLKKSATDTISKSKKSVARNPTKKLSDAEKKINQLEKSKPKEVTTGQKQQAVQILKDAKDKLKQSGKAKNKAAKKKALAGSKKGLAKGENLVKKGLATAKSPFKAKFYLDVASIVGGLATVYNNRKLEFRQRIRQGAKPKAVVTPIIKPKDKQDAGTKKKITQDEKIDEKTITIPEQGTKLDNKPATTQIRIITTILGGLAAAQAFRLRGKIVPKSQTRLRGGIRKAAKYIFNKLKKRRAAYTPDIYSLVFGIRAKRKEKIGLIRKGRVFSGLEVRKQVR